MLVAYKWPGGGWGQWKAEKFGHRGDITGITISKHLGGSQVA